MRDLAEYIISVSAAAILCGILNSLMLKGAAKEILKLISGLFLAFCVISPVSNIRLPELTDVGETIKEDAESAVRAGEDKTSRELTDSISAQLAAYILDKAKTMGLELEAEVTLADDGTFLPIGILLSGDASRESREQLTEDIAQDLGLPEEDIQWIGEP